MRLLMKSILMLAVGALLLFAGGFAHFIHSVGTQPAPERQKADAIIVLTGGADRITSAVDLLGSGLADRMLISGVYPNTTKDAIREQVEGPEDLFACCVDIDTAALDTVGNAREAARWATENVVRSVILVTSDYHIPRSLLEFRRAMPEVTVIAYPVRGTETMREAFQHQPQIGRRLISEYAKYLVVLSRSRAETFSTERLIARVRDATSL